MNLGLLMLHKVGMSEHPWFNMQGIAWQFQSLIPRWHWVLQKVQNVPCIGVSSHNEVFTSIRIV